MPYRQIQTPKEAKYEIKFITNYHHLRRRSLPAHQYNGVSPKVDQIPELVPIFPANGGFVDHHVEVLVVADEFALDLAVVAESDGDGGADVVAQQVQRRVVVVHC